MVLKLTVKYQTPQSSKNKINKISRDSMAIFSGKNIAIPRLITMVNFPSIATSTLNFTTTTGQAFDLVFTPPATLDAVADCYSIVGLTIDIQYNATTNGDTSKFAISYQPTQTAVIPYADILKISNSVDWSASEQFSSMISLKLNNPFVRDVTSTGEFLALRGQDVRVKASDSIFVGSLNLAQLAAVACSLSFTLRWDVVGHYPRLF